MNTEKVAVYLTLTVCLLICSSFFVGCSQTEQVSDTKESFSKKQLIIASKPATLQRVASTEEAKNNPETLRKKSTNRTLQTLKQEQLELKKRKNNYMAYVNNLKHTRVRYKAYQTMKQKKALNTSRKEFLKNKQRKMFTNDGEKYIIKKFTIKTTKDGKIERVENK